MGRVLIIAEHDGSVLNSSTARCVSCAATIPGAEVDVLVMAKDGSAVAGQAAALAGVSRVLLVEKAANEYPLAGVLAPQVVSIADGYSHVLGPSTSFGRDLVPRVAALLGVNQVSDIMGVQGSHEFRRPAYAGNVIQTVAADADSTVVGTVRIASYQAAATGGNAHIEPIACDADLPRHARFVELDRVDSQRPDLQTASRVVAGGRALGSAEGFGLVFDLADNIGAAVGATRAAVDAGFVANDLQVGQTGKIIAPELYFAIGISGAIQHVTGIKDAGTIVAINNDEEAPIFEVADIGLVADLFDVVPELTAALATSQD